MRRSCLPAPRTDAPNPLRELADGPPLGETLMPSGPPDPTGGGNAAAVIDGPARPTPSNGIATEAQPAEALPLVATLLVWTIEPSELPPVLSGGGIHGGGGLGEAALARPRPGGPRGPEPPRPRCRPRRYEPGRRDRHRRGGRRLRPAMGAVRHRTGRVLRGGSARAPRSALRGRRIGDGSRGPVCASPAMSGRRRGAISGGSPTPGTLTRSASSSVRRSRRGLTARSRGAGPDDALRAGPARWARRLPPLRPRARRAGPHLDLDGAARSPPSRPAWPCLPSAGGSVGRT